MKFGLHSVNLFTCADPDAAARLGRAAEAAGFESLWTADHVVLPDPPVAGRPMAPDMRRSIRSSRSRSSLPTRRGSSSPPA